jgi:hypothetical protein
MTEHEWTDDQIREFANFVETLAGKPPGDVLLEFCGRFPFLSGTNLERLVATLFNRRQRLAELHALTAGRYQ